MPFILTLVFAFLFFGCAGSPTPKTNHSSSSKSSTKSISPISIKELPISPQVVMLESRTIYDENQFIPPDISGDYELEQGTDNYKIISNAYMTIEKLDDINYGYYYAVQDEKATANSFLGIFRYKDGAFVNKVIESGTTTSLNDNIKLITEGQRLKLVVLTSYGRRTIIWSRVLEDGKKENEALKDAMKDGKIGYTQIYKNKFKEFTEI